jgi:hypothetical protein
VPRILNLRTETGLALPIAMGIMMVLAVALVAVIGFTSAGARHSDRSQAENDAFAVAEAGINVALSVLGNATNPTVSTLLPSTTTSVEGGTVTYSGTYAQPVWTITSTGRVTNPSSSDAADIVRTLNQKVTVQPLVPGATAPEWDRLFHNRTDVCLTINTVTVPASVTSRGDLCLVGTARITNSRSKVEVGDDVTLAAPNSSIGTSGSPIARAEVVGTCKYGTQAPATPCSPADRVFANVYTTTPPNLTKPTVDMAYWYQHAKPGPKHGCTNPGGSFPGGFDNDTTWNSSLPDYGNDNEDIDQVTPTHTSYSCKVHDANGDLVGEISWNHVTHVLKIHGTIFIDGNVRFDRDGQLVNYQGRAIIYAAGDLEYDEIVCAGGNGTHNCWSDMSNWDPEQNMMIILSGGWSEYDQGDDCCPFKPAAFQGVMYARDHCQIHQDFRSSGPIICDEIRIENTDGSWPDFYAWPELQSLIAGQMYGSFATAASYELILGEQVG